MIVLSARYSDDACRSCTLTFYARRKIIIIFSPVMMQLGAAHIIQYDNRMNNIPETRITIPAINILFALEFPFLLTFQ